MSKITLKGSIINTNGELPVLGSQAKEFSLVASDLSIKNLANFTGKKIILNVFPSVDTGTCAASVRRFNETAASIDNGIVLCISRDLPFAQARFCGAEGIENLVMLSDFKSGKFGEDYGLNVIEGPLDGLHSRCIIVINESGEIIYTEQVSEITEEPNYDLALASL